MEHRTTDKIFTNYDEDLSFKHCAPTHCDSASSLTNNEKTSGCDMIYTNSPARQYPPATMSVTESIGGCSVPYISLFKHLDPTNSG